MKDRWAQAFRIAQDGLWSIEDLKGISVLDEDTSEASQADDDMPLEQRRSRLPWPYGLEGRVVTQRGREAIVAACDYTTRGKAVRGRLKAEAIRLA